MKKFLNGALMVSVSAVLCIIFFPIVVFSEIVDKILTIFVD